jgi:hypothetical protein
MKWEQVNHTHHKRKASVSANATSHNPEIGEGPFIGIIVCKVPNNVPLLRIGTEFHAFAGWWDVELL